MYAQVKLLKGFNKPLWYKIPSSLENAKLLYTLVNVPIKKQTCSALVIDLQPTISLDPRFEVKEIISLESFPEDKHFSQFLSRLATFYFLDPIFFYKRLRSFLLDNDNEEALIPQQDFTLDSNISLTFEQQQIVNEIGTNILHSKFYPALLHGVTGSGKTLIYKKLIEQTLNLNKSAILILPEVSLSLQFEKIFRDYFNDSVEIFGFHSACKEKEKAKLWNSLLAGKKILIIGVHLPILLPIQNLGLIIVDEEHETSYIEKKHPKINSKEIAILRAQFYKIPIVLGSATPSLISLFNVEKKGWHYFQLTQRFSGKFPSIELAFLNEKEKRKNFWITKKLESSIKECLDRKEQAIIYINRRGFSFFIKCRECGFVFECPNCSVSLTPHTQNIHLNENCYSLICHYCGFSKNLPNNCPSCSEPSDSLITKGVGTQQVVSILRQIFPGAVIERADLDTTSKKRNWQNIVKKFENGEIDVLVGTQTITKGYHFPKVTLVGILWADLNLHLPFFNASEVTLQKLIQVAGRAGRECDKSKVIVQSMAPNLIFDYLDETRYKEFYEKEIEFRSLAHYPPVCRFSLLEIQNTNPLVLDKEVSKILTLLQDQNSRLNLELVILGPIRPAVYKIQKVEMRHIFIKADSFELIHKLFEVLGTYTFKSKIFINPTIS